jgi:hypothetical protein
VISLEVLAVIAPVFAVGVVIATGFLSVWPSERADDRETRRRNANDWS